MTGDGYPDLLGQPRNGVVMIYPGRGLPGLKKAYPAYGSIKNGTQIVPGVSIPIGAGPSRGDYGILFYFSVEHPFRKLTGSKK